MSFVHDSEFDLLVNVVRMMPKFIERGFEGGRNAWFIWNETIQGENFAEKWNRHPERAAAFFEWHSRFLADLERIGQVSGIDKLIKSFTDAFGATPVNSAVDAWTTDIGAARLTGSLLMAPTIGITTDQTASRVKPVRQNTFFGTD